MSELDPIVLIEVEKRFGRKKVHRGLDLAVPRGSVTALLGRNGAGKSTLLQMLTGLMPRDGGEIRVLGMDPWREPLKVKAAVGYVAEHTAFHPKWRVRDTIDLVRSLRKARWDRKEEWRLVDLFELPLGEKIGKLSKGYRAKLALLLALAHRPEVLLLDEPASGLDPIVKREVLASIVDTITEEGRTVLLSSHQMEDVERLADRVAFLAGGRIVLEGCTEEIRTNARRLAVGPIEDDRPLADLPGDPFVARRGREAVLTYLDGTNGAAELLGERFRDVNEIGVNLEDLFVDLLGAPREREEVVA
ncbi:MAG: ABC transporter ATP-binding protein [Planctomycetota bacterium]